MPRERSMTSREGSESSSDGQGLRYLDCAPPPWGGGAAPELRRTAHPSPSRTQNASSPPARSPSPAGGEEPLGGRPSVPSSFRQQVSQPGPSSPGIRMPVGPPARLHRGGRRAALKSFTLPPKPPPPCASSFLRPSAPCLEGERQERHLLSFQGGLPRCLDGVGGARQGRRHLLGLPLTEVSSKVLMSDRSILDGSVGKCRQLQGLQLTPWGQGW